MTSSFKHFNNVLQGLKTIEENFPRVLKATVYQDNISYSTVLKVKFFMETDTLCDCVYCFLQSEEGKSFMEENVYEFDHENEYFSKTMDFNLDDGTKVLVEVIELISMIKNMPRKDTNYFSEEERNSVIEEINELIGE